jgi:hypothetical protein
MSPPGEKQRVTFIESFARRCARLNADSLTVTKNPGGTLHVRYGERVEEVSDDPKFPERTLAAVRSAIDSLMGMCDE